MIDLLVDLLLAALILLAITGLGRALRRMIPLAFWSPAADLAYSFAFGLGAAATALFALSLVGLLVPAAGWVLLVVGNGLAIWHWRRIQEDARGFGRLAREVWGAGWFVRLFALMGAVFVIMNLTGDLAPPLEGDTIHQYLLTPREWVAAGRYVQPSNIWASTLPGNMMMISAWGLLLRDSFSLAALMTGFGMSLFFGAAVYALARLYVDRIPAALAAVVAYTMPDVGYLAQSAKVDMGWALFEALALAAVFRWMDVDADAQGAAEGRTRQGAQPCAPTAGDTIRWLALAGVCLGWAAGSKNQTFISIALLGLWVVLRLVIRGEWRGMLRAGGVFGASAAAAGFPYYLYNAIVHRNPFYPVFADVFVRFGGTASPRSELGTEIFYPWTVGGYFTNLWNMSLGHGADFYLGFIVGPIFLLIIPVGLALGLMRGQRALWRMLAYAFVFSVVWFLVKQAARHFLPGLALLAVISGYLLWQLAQSKLVSRRIVRAAAVLGLLGNLAVWAGVFYWHQAFRVALGMETRDQFLERVHDGVLGPYSPDWATIRLLNTELRAEDRVLTNNAASPLYITPQLVPGNWGDRIAYDQMDDPDALLAALEAHHIGYVLAYKSNTRPPLFASDEFLAAHGALIYDGPRTQLYQLVGGEGD